MVVKLSKNTNTDLKRTIKNLHTPDFDTFKG